MQTARGALSLAGSSAKPLVTVERAAITSVRSGALARTAVAPALLPPAAALPLPPPHLPQRQRLGARSWRAEFAAVSPPSLADLRLTCSRRTHRPGRPAAGAVVLARGAVHSSGGGRLALLWTR